MKRFSNDVFLVILFSIAGIAGIFLSGYKIYSISNLSGFDPEMRRRLIFISSMVICLVAANLILGIYYFLLNRSRNANFYRHSNQEDLMAEIFRNFISVSDTSNLINETLRMTGEFLNVGRVFVGILGDTVMDAGRAVFIWAKSSEYNSFANSENIDYLDDTVFPAEQPEKIQTLQCNNIDNESGYKMMKQAGIKAFLWAPLYLENKFWAVLGIENFTHRSWTESDQQLAGMVGRVIAATIERDLREKNLDSARHQAEMANKAKSDFLANMSHEMRTPMNAIIGMTNIAKKSSDPGKKEYCLNKIESASSHLLGIINDVLNMSKIEDNRFYLSYEEFNFERMLQKLVKDFNFRIEEKKQALTIHIDQGIPDYFLGDEQRLSQVIASLLSNAVKFTPVGGSIWLDAVLEEDKPEDWAAGTEQDSGWCILRVKVSDTGIGLTDEQKERLFTSFEQADSGTSRRFGGAGLGLAISKNIVEMMGGGIFAVSTPGNGASFNFTVRLKKSSRQKDAVNQAVDWKSIRVLAVDDDQNIRDYFGDIAERLGFKCDTASSGEEALYKMSNKGPYNFFFINWLLSDMEGIELSKRIKKTDCNCSVALMISAADWNVLDDDVKKTGTDVFLSKPLFPSGIVDFISKYLGKDNQIAALNISEIQTNKYHGQNIMLVEDVDINREIVIALLEPFGLTVTCAENGVEAVNLFKRSPENFDLILMDLQMPEMDGYEATRQIRAYEVEMQGQKAVPIIALTANVFKEDVDKCLSVGMNDHLGKPLDSNIVMDKLARYL